MRLLNQNLHVINVIGPTVHGLDIHDDCATEFGIAEINYWLSETNLTLDIKLYKMSTKR